MPILDSTNQEELSRYQDFVLNAKYTAITQDYHWQDIKQNWEPLHVYLEEDGNIIAAMSIMMIQNIEDKWFAYASKGPVLNEINPKLINRLVQEVEPTLKEKGVFLLRMDPEFLYDEPLSTELTELGYTMRNRNVAGHDTIQPRYNMLVDLREFDDAETLLASLYSKTRYRIRYPLKHNCTARVSSDISDLAIFYELYKTTSERHEISYRPYEYFERLASNYLAAGIMKIIIVEIEGVPDAAGIDFIYGNSVWYMYAGSTHQNQVLMAPYLVNWEGMKLALENKKDFYDLGGVFAPDKSDSLYTFKYMWTRPNGATEYIGEIDKVYDQAAYAKFIAR